MTEQLQRFIDLLKGIFELDKSDLDFGIYRIMNIRKKEIEKFLNEGLPARVQEALAPFATSTGDIEARLKEIETQCESVGIEVSKSKMATEYAGLKTRLAQGLDLSGLEADVYSHLYSFFNRYYEEGDFISKRRYKEGVYAIPYEGEEVKLYWANQDQYYIKTSENFKDYTFVAEGYTVHFRLVDATMEQNNNKESADSKRVFMLYAENEEQPELKTFEFDAEKREVFIRFVFDVPPEKKFDYAADNVKKIQNWIVADCKPLVTVLLANISTDPKKPLSVIEKHLKAYVAKNTFDYFIHKDLHGFLSRELDFYIKNEVMHLDDVDTTDEKRVDTWLAKVRAIKRVGGVLIDFLSQIENFQKKLWLKKKFVVSTNWCITLDKIDEKFYPEIAKNLDQWNEWEALGFFRLETISAKPNQRIIKFDKIIGPTYLLFLDTGAVEQIKGNYEKESDLATYSCVPVNFFQLFPYLILDTKHFAESFKEQIIAGLDDVNSSINGLMLNSDNFQALSLLKERYKGAIKGIYIDPPYNADATTILYKNGYRNSSWNSLLFDRIVLGNSFLSPTGIQCTTIDDYELYNLKKILDQVFGDENFLANVAIRNNPSGRSTVAGFAICHEYGLFYAKDHFRSVVGRLEHSDEQKKRYDNQNEDGRSFEWENFRKSSAGSYRQDRPKQFYPLFLDLVTNKLRIPADDVCSWNENDRLWNIDDGPKDKEIELLPIDTKGRERVWNFGIDRAREECDEMVVKKTNSGFEVYKKKYLQELGVLPRTWWDKP